MEVSDSGSDFPTGVAFLEELEHSVEMEESIGNEYLRFFGRNDGLDENFVPVVQNRGKQVFFPQSGKSGFPGIPVFNDESHDGPVDVAHGGEFAGTEPIGLFRHDFREINGDLGRSGCRRFNRNGSTAFLVGRNDVVNAHVHVSVARIGSSGKVCLILGNKTVELRHRGVQVLVELEPHERVEFPGIFGRSRTNSFIKKHETFGARLGNVGLNRIVERLRCDMRHGTETNRLFPIGNDIFRKFGRVDFVLVCRKSSDEEADGEYDHPHSSNVGSKKIPQFWKILSKRMSIKDSRHVEQESVSNKRQNRSKGRFDPGNVPRKGYERDDGNGSHHIGNRNSGGIPGRFPENA